MVLPKSYCLDCGSPKYYYATRCKSCSKKGSLNSRYGAKISKATKKKISEAASRRVKKPYGRRSDSLAAGRDFARRWFRLPKLCQSCKQVPPRDRHHKDGNPLNNSKTNIMFLCRRCHQRIDGRLEILRKNGYLRAKVKKEQAMALDRIAKVKVGLTGVG